MKKGKLILGIIITIIGGVTILKGMISGIYYFSGSLYENIQQFPINLSKASITDFFNANSDDDLSIWLKVPDRQIENKDITVIVEIIERHNNKLLSSYEEDFNFGYFRNSDGHGQYYKIGSYTFNNDIEGYLKYMKQGTWKIPYNGELVLRKSNFSFSFGFFKQIIFIAIGIVILIIGIGTIIKNSSNRKY